MTASTSRRLALGLTSVLAVSALTAVAAPSTALASDPAPKEPVNSCNARDNGDPSLNKLTITPNTVDVRHGSKKITVSALASDTGGPGSPSGVSQIAVELRSDADGTREIDLNLHRGKKAFHWTSTATVPQWTADGAWRVLAVGVVDKAGNSKNYGYDDLTLPVYERDLTVHSTPDTTGPVLHDLSLSPKRVIARTHDGHVVFTAKATDAESGIGSINVFATNGPEPAYADLHRVKGSPTTYRGTMSIGIGRAHRGKWEVRSVEVEDRVGNSTQYETGDLVMNGWDRTFKVVTSGDQVKPRVTGFQVSSRHFDVRKKAKALTIRMRARDAGSGIFAGIATLVDAHGDIVYATQFGPKAGDDPHDVNLAGRIRLVPCFASRGTFRLNVTVVDKAFNQRLLHKGKVTIKAKDHTAPMATVSNGSISTTGVTLDFSEAVDGISGSGIVFARLDMPGTQVPMSPITCYSQVDQGGTQVNCLTGHVRSATFMPIAAFTSGTYSVTINPEDNLDVTDLGGNPFHRDLLFFSVS